MNLLWLPALIPTTNPILHYFVAIIVFLFVLNREKIYIWRLVFFFCIAIYCLAFSMTGGDVTSIRYAVIVLLVISLYKFELQYVEKSLVFILLLNFVWAVFELKFPYSSLRLLFRSSLQEFHISRASGLFAFPGDLGHFACFCFAYFYILKRSIKIFGFNMHWAYSIIVSLFLLLSSQSRLAIIQLVLIVALVSLRQNKIFTVALFALLLSVLVFVPQLEYIRNTDIELIFKSLVAMDGSQFKRVSDLALLFGGKADLYPVPLPVEFVESGFVSQVFRLGGVLAVSIFTVILCLSTYVFIFSNINSLALFSSVVTLSNLVTNFVGAPFDRPKLMFYSSLILSIMFYWFCKIFNERRITNRRKFL